MKRIPSIWSEHLVEGTFYSDFPETSMYEFLIEQTAASLNEVAIEFEGVKTTYAGLISQIDDAAGALAALGVKKSDIITIVSPNIPQAIVTVYAANKVGAIANMLHPLLTAEEIQHHIENTESKAVFILDMFYNKIEMADWRTPIPSIVLYSISDALSFPKSLFVKRIHVENKPDTLFYWREFLAKKAEEYIYKESSPDDIALILYSGGTTGAQKGICLTNRNVNCSAVQGHDIGAGIRRTRTLAVLPIFHGFGLCTAIHNMLTCSSHLFLLPNYNAEKCNRLIFKKHIETIYAVPAIYDALIHSKEIRKKDYSFLKYMFCGGDQLKARTERTINKYMEKIHSSSRIVSGYGLTECVAGCLSNSFFWKKEGTSGMAFPDMEMKIVEPGTEKELPTGTPGELCVCGPTVMKGYFKDEAATREVLHVHKDGKIWLHTGDVFSADEDGFYTFHSRLSRMLVVNGYNVYPEMLENAILQIPGVAKCCVIGKPARTGGDRVIAFVCLADTRLTSAGILESCKNLLPEYAIPHQVIIRDTFPLTKVGKVDYRKLEGSVENE